MANLEEIRRALDRDELDYPALAAAFGEAALPELKAIVTEDNPRLASKAAYLAGLIAGTSSHEVVALAARSRHDVVRVAAAAAVALLPTKHAAEIAETLLQDPDPGVRVRAAKSASQVNNAALSARLKEIAARDPESHVRDIAADLSRTPSGNMSEGATAGRMARGDMTEGAATGRMPRGDMTEGAATGRMPRGDMTEGATTGRMPRGT